MRTNPYAQTLQVRFDGNPVEAQVILSHYNLNTPKPLVYIWPLICKLSHTGCSLYLGWVGGCYYPKGPRIIMVHTIDPKVGSRSHLKAQVYTTELHGSFFGITYYTATWARFGWWFRLGATHGCLPSTHRQSGGRDSSPRSKQLMTSRLHVT